MSTPSDTIRTATSHSVVPAAKAVIRDDDIGSSEVTSTAVVPNRVRSSVGDGAGVVLVGGDDQAARIGVRAPDVRESIDRVAEHRGQPVALDRQRRPQPLVGEVRP